MNVAILCATQEEKSSLCRPLFINRAGLPTRCNNPAPRSSGVTYAHVQTRGRRPRYSMRLDVHRHLAPHPQACAVNVSRYS